MSKVWFTTGAARGIGAEVVRAALAAGERVVAIGRQPERVTRALGASDRKLALPLNVTREDEAKAAVRAAYPQGTTDREGEEGTG
jgi:NAD(P)-dependent dehydrogenase (short-subunit alcohol dehydrogenase family)